MKALIVDDEKHVRDCINLLADWTLCDVAEVFEADTVDEAIACIDRELPQIVFTDIRMPEKDGLELLEWLHDRHPEINVIVISGYSEFDYAIGAMHYGALDYLLKPIHQDQINKVLEKIRSKYDGISEVDDVQKLTVNERVLLALLAEGDTELPTHSQLHRLFYDPCGLMVFDLFCIPAIGNTNKHLGNSDIRRLQRHIEEILGGGQFGCAIQCNSFVNILFVLLTGSADEQERYAKEILLYTGTFFCGALLHNIRYKEVRDASMLHKVLSQSLETISIRPLLECHHGTAFTAPQNTERFFNSILNGNRAGAEAIIDQWILSLRNMKGITLGEFHTWWNTLSKSYIEIAEKIV